MKIALIELFVPSRHRVDSDRALVLRSLAQAPDDRNAAALEALTAADVEAPDADIILFPGWTFVADDAVSLNLPPRMKAAVVFETISKLQAQRASKTSKKGDGAGYDWSAWVMKAGRAPEEVPSQCVALGRELDAPNKVSQLNAAIAARSVTKGAALVICGEMNLVRFRSGAVQPPDAAIRALLREGVVLNPTHTPNSSYMLRKQRSGHGRWWKALLSTSNTFDPRNVLATRRTIPWTPAAYPNRNGIITVSSSNVDRTRHGWSVNVVEVP